MKILNTLSLLLFSSCLLAQVSNGVTLLDNWQNPDLPDAGSFSYSDVWGYTDCNGNEYGILGSSAFIHFFNVTDPTNIVEIASFEGNGPTVWRDLKTYGTFAYSVCDSCNEGLMIFDLSQLPEVVTLSQQTTEYFGRSHNIFVDEEAGRLYAVGTDTNPNGLHVFDLTEDPGNPVLLAEPSLPGGYVHDINVVNNLAFASSGNNGLYVYDFTDPANFELLGTLTQYPEQGYNHSSWPTADLTGLVMADETFDRGLKMLDISDLEDITVQDVFRSELLAPDATGSIAHNPFVRGDYVFISYYHDGLQVFDISDPENVVQVAGYDTQPNNTNYNGFTGMWGTYPFLPSGTILCSDVSFGFFTLGMDNLELAATNPPSFPEAVLTEMGETEVCTGQTVPLFVNPGAESYEWMNDGVLVETTETNNYAATTAGDWTVTAANRHCRTTAEETITVVINEYPDASVSVEGDAFLCGTNDSEVLEIADENADGYIWYLNGQQITGEVNQFLETEVTGVYTAIAISNGCISESNEITIDGFQDDLDLEVSPSEALACVGESVELSVEDNYDNYQWTLNGDNIEGENGTSLTVSEAGEYGVAVSFSENCTLNGTAGTVSFVEAQVPAVTLSNNILIAGDAASWQWLVDGNPIDGATEQSYTPTATGSYSLEFVDENGCTGTSEAVEVIISGIYSVETGVIRIFPNPVPSEFEIRLETSARKASYRIYDVTGRLLTQQDNIPTTGSVIVEAEAWAAGVYTLELVLDGKSVVTERLIKM